MALGAAVAVAAALPEKTWLPATFQLQPYLPQMLLETVEAAAALHRQTGLTEEIPQEYTMAAHILLPGVKEDYCVVAVAVAARRQ
jgi:hypothetical protein